MLGLGAEHSVGAGTGEALRLLADDVTSDIIPDCGHWATEERPEWIARRMLRFLSGPD